MNNQESKKSELLKLAYQAAVEGYMIEFLNRHDLGPYDQSDWIGDVGDIYECADMFMNFYDIRFDVDNNIPDNMYEKWYWDSLECAELGISFPNYQHWFNGAPTPSHESIQRIKNMKQNLADLILIENNKYKHVQGK